MTQSSPGSISHGSRESRENHRGPSRSPCSPLFLAGLIWKRQVISTRSICHTRLTGSLRVRGDRGALQLRRTGASTHAGMRARSHNSQDIAPIWTRGAGDHTRQRRNPELVRECIDRDLARAWTYHSSCKGTLSPDPREVRPARWVSSTPSANAWRPPSSTTNCSRRGWRG